LIESRHFCQTPDDPTRRNHRDVRPALSSLAHEVSQHAEALCIDVLHARQIERNVRRRRCLDVRRPQILVCTVPENQPTACPYHHVLGLAE